jgi:hypothetical protein
MKTRLNYLFGITLLLLLGFMSCTKPVMENACENISVDDKINSARVLIMSAFSPNGDGLNDRFRPLILPDIIEVDTLWGTEIYAIRPTITSFQVKEWNSEKVIYDGTWNDFQGWDGTKDGETCSGYYKYIISITTVNGFSKTYQGEVCSFTEQGKCCKNADKCVFEEDFIGAGIVDPTVASGGC